MELQNKVESIPSGIFTCYVENQEVGVLALGRNGLTIRYPKNWSLDWAAAPKIRITYLVIESDTYEEFLLTDYSAHMVDEQEFYNQITLYITGVDGDIRPFCDVADFVIKQYFRYIEAKLDSEGNEFSKDMCGYPANLDSEMASSYQEFLQEQYQDEDLRRLQDWVYQQQELEVGISLENPDDYEEFANWEQMQLPTQKSMRYCRADVIYIGNQWCHMLFPKKAVLLNLMDVCKANNKKIVITFSYLRNSRIEEMKDILAVINEWCEQNQTHVEIVINDYGMISMLANYHKWMKVRLGLLLNKRRKDPRMQYHLGWNSSGKNGEKARYLAENHLNTDLMREFLQENEISGIEYESVGYAMAISGEDMIDCTLHLPFYQTNTSQYCTLYAMCKYGNRAVQHEITTCPVYCRNHVIVYPKHLHLIGRYNSLFGVDHEISKHPEWIENYRKMGVRRIIWNMD